MKTLLVNPPSFEKFDGGAGARYPATREITSFWYPTWLAYAAGLIPESRLLDAPSHGVSPEETVRISRDFEFVVLFTSTPGFSSDLRLAERMKNARPGVKVAFVGPHATALPEESLRASAAIDFVARREFDYAVAEFARGGEARRDRRDQLPERGPNFCRLLVVGFESGDPGILKSIKKGATVDQALAFMKNCRQAGLAVHGDFQIGHPGETPESIEKTVQFALRLDPKTIQVSISHPYPGTQFYNELKNRGYLTCSTMTDEQGHQLPNLQYPGLSGREIVQAVEDFYGRYYFRPRIIFRIVGQSLSSGAERRRLFREGKEFFRLRSHRKKFIHSCKPNAPPSR